MIVHNLYIVSISIVPAKAEAPLIVDADAVLAGPAAAELLEPVPWKYKQSI